MRLIDADVLEEFVIDLYLPKDLKSWILGIVDAQQTIQKKTAKATIEYTEMGLGYLVCNKCKCSWPGGDELAFIYCPNCGAKFVEDTK